MLSNMWLIFLVLFCDQVKVSALMDGIVQAVEVNVGTRVVEGALMFRVVAK